MVHKTPRESLRDKGAICPLTTGNASWVSTPVPTTKVALVGEDGLLLYSF